MSGTLSRESLFQTIRILQAFAELLAGWGVEPRDALAIATSAVREARNREIFLDRIRVRVGFLVRIIEGVEESQLTYIAVQHATEGIRSQFRRGGQLIIEVGGGTTEVMLLNQGRMVAVHSLRIGTVRLEQQAKPGQLDPSRVLEFVHENVRVARANLDSELRLERVRHFVAVGGDARLAAAHIGSRAGDRHWSIREEDFSAFVRDLQQCSVDECVRRLRVTYNEAEGLVPALLILKLFLEATSAEEIIVPDVSIREGMLVQLALGQSEEALGKEFLRQVVSSARSLGQKYRYDEAHALHVADIALQLFDLLHDDHGLGKHERLLLEVASILHDIGTFVRAGGHHRHGYYIVVNSELFGFSQDAIDIIANVVRYHRGSMPSTGHPAYASLNPERRMIVQKLAAILRVADSLDRRHGQRIERIRTKLDEDVLEIMTGLHGDLSVERYGLSLKAKLFENVFGYRVTLS